ALEFEQLNQNVNQTDSSEIDQENVNKIENPLIRRPKGRPAGTARFKGPLETSNVGNRIQNKCGLCYNVRHNRAMCPSNPSRKKRRQEVIRILYYTAIDLGSLHKSEYCHKGFHSGNILQDYNELYITDFGLSGPADKQKSDNKIFGVLPYIAPEVLNEELYTFASNIYSFGVIIAEMSSRNPPFFDRKHDLTLALDVCNGLRSEFGEGTPEFYKKLAYSYMNAIPNQRTTADELYKILKF
ncbi:19245_t:CDS:2, partial [Funneliformis geosporum]